MSGSGKRTRRGRPSQEDRPKRIAEAAIRILSENGSRGLSHRRTDNEAGLPIGSTVHYAPTRNDLLILAARRLAELSRKELEPFANDMRAYGNALTAETVARGMVTFWHARLAQDQLYRLRAELTLLLSQDIETELREAIKHDVDAVLSIWQDLMARLGSRRPEVTADEFGIWSRGLFYMLALQGGLDGRDKLVKVERWTTQFLTAMLEQEREFAQDTQERL